jgi:uncharacterized protein YyaL (SSP411 family)
MSSHPNLRPNRLALEKSPYLLQHAFNPVDWFPWSEEAFNDAKLKDKPVFLSIGYSTCHWCHVMEKESFEDPEVARLLNETFICIKVDREERPDLDATYVKVCQALTGTGGWPLHIVMTPDKKPFFAATYLPKENRFGQVGLLQLAEQVNYLWTSRRDELLNSAEKIINTLTEEMPQQIQATEKLGEQTLDEAFQELVQNYDEGNGGFGNAPKFPSPQNLTFLLRYWKGTGNEKALEMVEKTLKSMRLGGIYDQLGFGFHRYSTDSRWLVPHFEKMLYDQAMLLMAYTEAFQATRKEDYGKTAKEIILYVLREMTDTVGGFYSAEDADSDGEEGKYYLWTQEEIRQALPNDEADFIEKVFNVQEKGNYEEATTGLKTGKNVLFLRKPLDEIAEDVKISLQELAGTMNEARHRLLVARSKRTHPNKDDKILSDWNGLMIAALAESAAVFNEPEYARVAERAATFVLTHMVDENGRLLHRYRQGDTAIPGFLDDYAFMIWGLIELYEAKFNAEHLKSAIKLAASMISYFWDEQRGGFFQTADDTATTLGRNKEAHDGAYPSGNSVAALDLIRLARLTGETKLEDKAAELMRAFAGKVSLSPSAYTHLMIALDFALGPSSEVVIAGDLKADKTQKMLEALHSRFIPRKVLLLRSSTEKAGEIARMAKFTEYMVSTNGKPTAYVCQNHTCKLPTADPETMLQLLGEKKNQN